ncbi:MAG: acyl-ACP--UDP-N-acetylglucosamine O-acyltransferase [Deltaproteobacteria bacterium]|nr:MAG: acyl-ACP--UDP-N-acetylglucosamine O-acyltransferase [Deltaproteobacteria bacterium]
MTIIDGDSPIHPTAVIDPGAEIHPEAEVGPYVVIDGPVKVGRGTRIMAHAYLTGWTEIGEDNRIHMGTVIGHEPQDVDYEGGRTYLKIGHRNIIREHAEIHRGTKPESATLIGDDNFIMNHAHIAHNCEMGNGTVLAGGALLAGYVRVEDAAFISGNCVVHQFVRIGKLAMLRGLSRTSRDVPPFCIMDDTHTVRGINQVGLDRAGYGKKEIRELRQAFSRLFGRRGNLTQAIQELEARESLSEEVAYLLNFIKSSERGVCFGPKRT